MPDYLPDTALTSVAVSRDVIHTYAQLVSSVIVECTGQLEAHNQDTYAYDLQSQIVARYRGNVERPNAPKLFTPLAASYLQPNRTSVTQYIFYVDDTNTIRGAKSPTTNAVWPEEPGISALTVRCAHYSQLTAITISENNFQAICVYYQSPSKDGGIQMISYSTKNRQWVRGVPDMKPVPPPPPPRIVDAPLYGTSLMAVAMRNGLQVVPNSTMPVVYLQWDTLSLAHSQESVETIRTLDLRFAPHTSLTAVDEGDKLYCFYTSSQNNHIKMISIKDSKASTPVTLATPTPRSSIASVLPTRDRIIIFYQSLNFAVGKVELSGNVA